MKKYGTNWRRKKKSFTKQWVGWKQSQRKDDRYWLACVKIPNQQAVKCDAFRGGVVADREANRQTDRE